MFSSTPKEKLEETGVTAIKLLSLFSGIGAFEKALNRLGKKYELVNYCEIDKFASKAYSLIHKVPESMNLVDVTQIDCAKLPKGIDMITYGFPCQDISIAGKQRGLEADGVKTRSGLVFDALHIIEEVKPKYAICENVKNLTGKKFKLEFEYILKCLEELGYNNYWKVLNAADYGVPQKRERVFIVSIRKDIDKGSFDFPEPIPLQKTLKDLMEKEVDSKYFLSERLVNYFYENMKKNKEKGNGFSFKPISNTEVVAKTITTKAGIRMDDNFIKVKELTSNQSQAKRVYDSEGLAVTIKSCAGGLGAKTGLYEVDSNIKVVGYYQPSCHEASRVLDAEGIAPTVKENHGTVNAVQLDSARKTSIRKLTPKECFRLMGFEDKDIDVLKQNNISDTQLYKMAGNSIVVDVLYYIFKNLLKDV